MSEGFILGPTPVVPEPATAVEPAQAGFVLGPPPAPATPAAEGFQLGPPPEPAPNRLSVAGDLLGEMRQFVETGEINDSPVLRDALISVVPEDKDSPLDLQIKKVIRTVATLPIEVLVGFPVDLLTDPVKTGKEFIEGASQSVNDFFTIQSPLSTPQQRTAAEDRIANAPVGLALTAAIGTSLGKKGGKAIFKGEEAVRSRLDKPAPVAEAPAVSPVLEGPITEVPPPKGTTKSQGFKVDINGKSQTFGTIEEARSFLEQSPEVTVTPTPVAPVAPPIRVPIATLNTQPGATKAFLQRNFTSRGDLPKDVFAKKVAKDAAIGAEIKQTAFVTRELQRGLKETPVAAKALDAALKGEISINALPEAVQAPVSRMRDHMDTLSRRMIDSGVVEGDMAAVVENNMGVYVTRSYRVFDDPAWASKVTTDVRNKAKALVRKEYSETIPQEYARIKEIPVEQAASEMRDIGSTAWTYQEGRVSGVIESMLFEGKASDSPVAMIRRGNLGSKDLSILQPRKPIAPEIRALFGEHTDPVVNYTRSVTKMSHLIENQKFLTEVRTEGRGSFFHDQPIVIEGVEYKTRIAAEGSEVMAPLNGLYTTPEIKTAFQTAMEPQNSGPLFSAYMKVNGTVKFAKTVGSVMTHVRNVVGNTGFAIANGHFRVSKTGDAFKTVMSDLAGSDRVFQDRYLKYQRLGVVGESARAGELLDVIKDARKHDMTSFSELNAVQRGAEKALKVATDIYRAEDDIWKIYAFENEMTRYRKALPEMPIEQVETLAAGIVRNTYPTYSLVPQGVKALRRFPLVGTFVSFPAEVVRTVGNTMQLMTKEITSGNPAIRAIGSQRLAGMMVAATGVASMAATSRFIAGMTAQDDQDAREFMPPWSKNSDIIWLGEKDGNRLWIDLSYTDPHSYLKAPLQAFLRGDTWEDKVVGAGVEAAEPFLGEEILAGSMLDVARNSTETGGQVYNPQSDWVSIATDIGQHIGESFTPGTVSSVNRIQKGLRGVVEPYGRTYDPKLEALATFTGTRINSLNVSQGLAFRARDYNRENRNATQILTEVLKNQGTVSANQLTEAYGDMESSRREIFDNMVRAASAARSLGKSEREVFKILKNNRLSEQTARDVIRGIYRPYTPKATEDIPSERIAVIRGLIQ